MTWCGEPLTFTAILARFTFFDLSFLSDIYLFTQTSNRSIKMPTHHPIANPKRNSTIIYLPVSFRRAKTHPIKIPSPIAKRYVSIGHPLIGQHNATLRHRDCQGFFLALTGGLRRAA